MEPPLLIVNVKFIWSAGTDGTEVISVTASGGEDRVEPHP